MADLFGADTLPRDRAIELSNRPASASNYTKRGRPPDGVMTHQYTARIGGYTGSVGGALARELAARGEWQVYGLARHPPAPGLAGVTRVAPDMADQDGLRRAPAPLDFVTHLFYRGRATHAEQVIEDAPAEAAAQHARALLTGGCAQPTSQHARLLGRDMLQSGGGARLPVTA